MPTKKKPFPTDPKVLNAYKKMLEAVPVVDLKGATTPYTSHNGNMFSSVSKANCIGLRLSKEDREMFIEKYETTLFEAIPNLSSN